MKLKNTVIAAISGTTFMTLFSHIVSEVDEENYSEPLLLSKLVHRLVPAMNKEVSKVVGWKAHYAVGLAFMAAYEACLKATGKKPNAQNGLLMGGLSGLLGIAMWKSTFKAHPAPPLLPYKKYYAQLFAAHIVFGIIAAETLKILERNEEAENIDKAG